MANMPDSDHVPGKHRFFDAPSGEAAAEDHVAGEPVSSRYVPGFFSIEFRDPGIAGQGNAFHRLQVSVL